MIIIIVIIIYLKLESLSRCLSRSHVLTLSDPLLASLQASRYLVGSWDPVADAIPLYAGISGAGGRLAYCDCGDGQGLQVRACCKCNTMACNNNNANVQTIWLSSPAGRQANGLRCDSGLRLWWILCGGFSSRDRRCSGVSSGTKQNARSGILTYRASTPFMQSQPRLKVHLTSRLMNW